MNDIKSSMQSLGVWANQNKVPIQIGAGIALNAGGVIATVIATRKIVKTLEGYEDLSFWQKLGMTWKYLVAPAALEVGSTVCLVSAAKGHVKQVAGLSTALSMSEAALREYKGKVEEKLGEKTTKEIEHDIAQDKVNKSKAVDDEPFLEGEGPEVFYDMFLDRYFLSSTDKINKAASDLRNAMYAAELSKSSRKGMLLSLNKFYEKLGLSTCEAGSRNYICNYDTIGSPEPFDVSYQSCFRRDGVKTCRAISYPVVPCGTQCLPYDIY